ncbi:MAG: hypothetical protein RLZZ337_950 [Bacteroidota bacterium]|jgi:pyridoxamine 5'-phosphate oxidase
MKDLRVNYTKHELVEAEAGVDPLALFERWFNDAQLGGVPEPNAMILSSAVNNKVDSRTVLLKGVRDEEFVFFTNYNSDKGQQLAANPNCTLLFLWLQLERQVIIRGTAQKVSASESDEYFYSRPVESRIGAWASNQSSVIESREALENQAKKFAIEFANKDVERPPHWGGYAVIPFEIEFWQGRPSRLHDRLLYKKSDNLWELVRLQP